MATNVFYALVLRALAIIMTNQLRFANHSSGTDEIMWRKDAAEFLSIKPEQLH